MTLLRTFFLAAGLTPAVLAPAALAQTPGQKLWAIDVENVLTVNGRYTTIGEPRVGPNGTVYVPADSLYALTPTGDVLWTAPVRPFLVDVGPDGTVYASSDQAIHAFAPDGTEKWTYTDSQGTILGGPTVGPDGNVYAVFELGLGAVSLTPDGELRWNVPGFVSRDGNLPLRIPFGPDNFYFADETVPGCTNPTKGLVSITLDGEVDWCRVIPGVFGPSAGPQATLDGRAVVWQNANPGDPIQAYTPDGDLDWTQSFLPTNVGVGPDNNLYAFHDVSTLISLTADGEQRWAVEQPITTFASRAVVAPDLSAVVSGSVYGFGVNGTIIAADPVDGHTLWSLPLTGPSAGAAPGAFSPSGEVVYVPVNTLSDDEPDQLWAVQVREARPSAAEPEGPAASLVLSAPAPSPTRGASRLTLNLSETGTAVVDVLDALGRRVALLHDGPLSAGTHPFTIDAVSLPAGVYLVRAVVGGRASVTRQFVVVR